ncbi:MAG: M28 family peptidase [Chitinophagaceae bacterium]
MRIYCNALQKAVVTLFAFTWSVTLHAQNQPPSITDVKVQLTEDNQVKIRYVVKDKEEKNISVDFYVSTDDGKTFTKQTAGVQGDVGASVATGKKSMSWNYSDFKSDIKNAKFRLVADDGFKLNVADLVAQVDTNRLRARLTAITGIRDNFSELGKAQLGKVKNIIQTNFTGNNFSFRRQPFVFGGYSGENFIAKKIGTRKQDSIYVVVAAFDGAENSPAANNNGSGLAGLLEISDIISKYNFKNTVVVLSTDYTAEEFVGSKYFVFRGGIEKHERVDAALDLDRIGTFSNAPNTHPLEANDADLFPKMYEQIKADSARANFLRIISNPLSRPLADKFKDAAARYVPDLKIHTQEYPGYGEFVRGTFSYVQFSDHICFWYRKYKALWLSDAREGSRRDNTSEDDVNMINFKFLSDVVKISLATLVEMAGLEHSGVYEGSFVQTAMALK